MHDQQFHRFHPRVCLKSNLLVTTTCPPSASWSQHTALPCAQIRNLQVVPRRRPPCPTPLKLESVSGISLLPRHHPLPALTLSSGLLQPLLLLLASLLPRLCPFSYLQSGRSGTALSCQSRLTLPAPHLALFLIAHCDPATQA